MDRHKFRVWATQNGEGRYYHAESGCPFLMNLNGDVINAPSDRNPRVNDTCFARVAYNDVTVEQCTGLKDADGTLIYEGDIVMEWGEWYIPAQIKWDDEGFLAVVWVDMTEPVPEYPKAVIIGNIHENPELLEASDA